MNDKSEIKFIIFFILFWALAIAIYFLYDHIKEEKEISKNFTTYQYYDIKNNIEKINEIKLKMNNDPFLLPFLSIDSFNGKITDNNLDEIFLYFLSYANTLNEKVYMVNDEKICIKNKYFFESFYELFNIRLNNESALLKKDSILNIYNDNYCFNIDISEIEDRVHYAVANTINIENNYIKGNFYYYSFYTNDMETENEIKSLLENSIWNNSIKDFNEIFINQYHGDIEEKNVKFEELPKGKYYKYKLVSMETKDYN